MQFKNEKEMNPNLNAHQTSTNCSTSSTDSGVIIIDNIATFNRTKSNSSSSKNFNRTAAAAAATSTTTTTKDNNNGETKDFIPRHCNNGPTHNNNNNNTNKSYRNSDISDKSTNINIENILNISKASRPSTPTSSTAEYNDRHPTGDINATTATNSNSNSNNTTTTTTTTTNVNPSKSYSPTISIRSTTISIISIDENAVDSSVVDSDSDFEGDAEGVHSNYIVKKLGQQTTFPPDSAELPNINKGMTVISQQIRPNGLHSTAADGGDLAENILNGKLCVPPPPNGPGAVKPSTPQIGSIALTNSTDVTFGDKHFYEGPVTIQQFLIDSRDKSKPTDEEGQDNPIFNGESAPTNGPKVNPPSSQSPAFVLNRKAIIITGTIIVLTIIAGVIIATTTKLFESSINKSKKLGDGDDSRKNIPINSTIGQDNIGGGRILRIVPRDAWLAQPPQTELVSQSLPVHRVIVISTQTEDCSTQAECTFRVRFIQTYNIESLQNDDIIYNFLIGGDGNVYEGRGWSKKGAHLKGYNDDSVSFAYIGTFRKEKPSPNQMNITKLLLAEGVRRGKLDPDYRIVGANVLAPTVLGTSAALLYESFKNWPHWSM